MTAIMLNPGKYYVGKAEQIFPGFVFDGNHVVQYGAGHFFVMEYAAGPVAVVPVELVESSVLSVTFDKETLFVEIEGKGYLGDINLGTIGDQKPTLEELKAEVLSHLPHMTNTDNPIDFPHVKKRSRKSATRPTTP
jgi:hypothetical protein